MHRTAAFLTPLFYAATIVAASVGLLAFADEAPYTPAPGLSPTAAGSSPAPVSSPFVPIVFDKCGLLQTKGFGNSAVGTRVQFRNVSNLEVDWLEFRLKAESGETAVIHYAGKFSPGVKIEAQIYSEGEGDLHYKSLDAITHVACTPMSVRFSDRSTWTAPLVATVPATPTAAPTASPTPTPAAASAAACDIKKVTSTNDDASNKLDEQDYSAALAAAKASTDQFGACASVSSGKNRAIFLAGKGRALAIAGNAALALNQSKSAAAYLASARRAIASIPASDKTSPAVEAELAAATALLQDLAKGLAAHPVSSTEQTPPAGRATQQAALEFLYVLNGAGKNVSAFGIDRATGALNPVPGSPFSAGTTAFGIQVDPFGKFLYVVDVTSDAVIAYRIDRNSGALAPVAGSPFAVGTFPVSSSQAHPKGIILDRAGELADVVYGGLLMNAGVRTFKVDPVTGALSGPISDSPVPFYQSYPRGMSHYFYMPNDFNNTVIGYSIDQTTGKLGSPVPGSPFKTGEFPLAVAVDPSERFVYVTNGGKKGAISVYAIDPASGRLREVADVDVGASYTTGIALDTSGNFLYVAVAGTNSIDAFRVDAHSGILTALPDSPFAAGAGPGDLVTVRPQ